MYTHFVSKLHFNSKGTSKGTCAKASYEGARFAHVHIQARARTSPLNHVCGFKWPLESLQSRKVAPSTALRRVANRSIVVVVVL